VVREPEMCLHRWLAGGTILTTEVAPATASTKGGRRMADTAYCMKCREKRDFEGHLVTLKNGRPALQGTCPVCGTKLTKIMGMDAAKAMGWSAP
jgi:hypothetical protein